ncbi:MAG: discoidin domain-containing protein, partial [Paramuribaculum sp.]|nr:discoidin domain-containing protein [Paramuribaculum sp.]
ARSLDDMVYHFLYKLTGIRPAIYKGIGTYPNLRTSLSKLMLDNDTTTYYTSANSQGAGDWIGVDLGELRPVEEIIVHQGRNSVDDVDYFDNVALEYSTDGRQWIALTDSLPKTYIVTWEGAPVEARYVRLKRLDSDKKNWASVRSFKVNPPSAKRIPLNVTASDAQGALLAFDSNPMTTFDSKDSISFDRKSKADKLIILGTELTPAFTLLQLDSKGNTIAQTPVNTAYSTIAIEPAAVRFTLRGNGKLAEIIQQ